MMQSEEKQEISADSHLRKDDGTVASPPHEVVVSQAVSAMSRLRMFPSTSKLPQGHYSGSYPRSTNLNYTGQHSDTSELQAKLFRTQLGFGEEPQQPHAEQHRAAPLKHRNGRRFLVNDLDIPLSDDEEDRKEDYLLGHPHQSADNTTKRTRTPSFKQFVQSPYNSRARMLIGSPAHQTSPAARAARSSHFWETGVKSENRPPRAPGGSSGVESFATITEEQTSDSSARGIRRAPARKWSSSEDDALRAAVQKHGGKNWKLIAADVPGRSHVQCLQRYRKVLAPGLKKGHWSPQEDEKLRYTVAAGVRNWGTVAQQIPGRTAKQCRERWTNHLDPSINKGGWTHEEDRMLLQKYEALGQRWSKIASHLPGRTENAVKIRWKSLQRKNRRKLSRADSDTVDSASTEARSAVDFSECSRHSDQIGTRNAYPGLDRNHSNSVASTHSAPVATSGGWVAPQQQMHRQAYAQALFNNAHNPVAFATPYNVAPVPTGPPGHPENGLYSSGHDPRSSQLMPNNLAHSPELGSHAIRTAPSFLSTGSHGSFYSTSSRGVGSFNQEMLGPLARGFSGHSDGFGDITRSPRTVPDHPASASHNRWPSAIPGQDFDLGGLIDEHVTEE